MNIIDGLLGAVVVLSVWGGWRRGLLLAGTDLLALAASIAGAFWLYPHGARIAEQQGWGLGVWAAPLAFLGAYVLIRLVLGAVLAGLLRAVPRPLHAHAANRVLGLAPGLANGLINATIVAMVLLALPLSDGFSRLMRGSVLADRLAVSAGWLEAALRPIFDPALDRTLGKLTIEPGSQEVVSLPFTVADASPRPDLEAAMLVLLNEERRAHGLAPLEADPKAAEVARMHSRDMFARGYFAHVSPEGEDAFERMRHAGLRFGAAGENLALARTLPMAHQGLMNSSGHRANILRPAFRRVGIGILDGGRYGLMVTQNFRN